jgi:outer membrane biosynthesis protein TonB
VGLHVAVLAFAAFATTAPELPAMPQTVRVKLVAAAPEDAPVRQDPTPPEVAEEEHRPPPPDPTPDPQPQTETPTVEAEVPVEREPEPEPARAEEVGEEAVNVQIEGANTQFPEYFQNIIRQVQRYWRPPAGARDLRAEISFVIHRDGSVDGIEWVRKSGSAVFDLQARGAIETAARQVAFGPLPNLYPADAMRVSFYFDPTTR